SVAFNHGPERLKGDAMNAASPATWRVVAAPHSELRLTRFLLASQQHVQIEMLGMIELIERQGPDVSIAKKITSTMFQCRGAFVRLTFRIKEPGIVLLVGAQPIAVQSGISARRDWTRFSA